MYYLDLKEGEVNCPGCVEWDPYFVDKCTCSYFSIKIWNTNNEVQVTPMIAVKTTNSIYHLFELPCISLKTGLPKQTTQPQEETVGSVCPGQAQSEMLRVLLKTRGDGGPKYWKNHHKDFGRQGNPALTN